MDFELKNFENKINDITNQFMSLLDSNDVIGDTITDKVEKNSIKFGYSMDGISAGEQKAIQDAHAIPLNNDDSQDLNKRLEELYQARKFDSGISYGGTENKSYIGTNVGVFNNVAANNGVSYTKDKTSSEQNKEGYTMANYGFNTDEGNSLFSFATVPEERALVAKKSFTDVLFTDIPWDTKIDILGGIKSLFNVDVKFTF